MAECSTRLVVVVATGMDEYQTRLLQGAQPVLANGGMSVLAYLNGPLGPGLPKALVNLLCRTRPAGVLLTNVETDSDQREIISLLRTLDIPGVFLGIDSPDATSVHGDNVTGMRALMAHLLDDHGVRRPALVRGIRHQADSVAREQVFRDELAARDIPVDEDLVIDGNFWNDTAYRAMWDLLKRRRDMDAVVALNDLSALGTLGALAAAGLRVPEDVLVTGFDNDQVAALNWPGLTSVDQDLPAQGAVAAAQLLAQMDGALPAREIVVPSHLVTRGSTADQAAWARGQVDAAMGMARAAQTRMAAQDAVIGMNRAMMRSRTIADVATGLAACLEWVGIKRCFLALHERIPGDGGVGSVDTTRSHLVLDYRDGVSQPVNSEVYPSHRLLPRELQGELGSGVLAMQPLKAGDEEIGYVMFERSHGPVTVSEVFHADLSRTLEALVSNQWLQDHAAQLERIVVRRTQELRAEVEMRRRTEQELQAEVEVRRRAEEELRRSAMQDGLTRIANRAAFQQHLDHHWQRQAESGDELALLMVDVDLFKAYNDHYGHVLGDETLRTVADCLQRVATGPDDLACRYGGEEFVLVLPGSDSGAALAVATAFRELLADAAIPHAISGISATVTASIGVATVRARLDLDPAALVEAADRALYTAKSSGRDGIALADDGWSDGAVDGRGEVPAAVRVIPQPRAAADDETPAPLERSAAEG